MLVYIKMPRFNLTDKHKAFIKANYQTMGKKTMAKRLGIGVTPINRYMKENDLTVTKEQSKKFRSIGMIGRTSFTKEQDEFIKANYLKMPVKEIANRIGRSAYGTKYRMDKLGLVVPAEIIKQHKIDSQFKKGMVSHNKGKKQSEFMSPEAIERTKRTRFKNGNLPHNTKEKDGAISIRKDKNGIEYKYIRTSLSVWEALHRYTWMQHHGHIPENFVVTFKDGNTLNCDINNLECISMSENMLRNSKHNYPKSIIPKLVANSKTKKLIRELNKQIQNQEK